VVTFLEGLGDGEAGFSAPQSGTMMQPIAKSNVAAQATEKVRRKNEAKGRVRFFIG
jgi:hypothetical protein